MDEEQTVNAEEAAPATEVVHPGAPAGEPEAEPDQENTPEWLQRRLDREVAKRHEAERDASILRQQLLSLYQRLQSPQMAAEGAQMMGNMNDTERMRAIIQQELQRINDVHQQRGQAHAAMQTRQASIRSAVESTRSLLAEGKRLYDDFEEVAFGADHPVSGPMAEAISTADNPADIAYWLGKNPHEAERINRLGDMAALREIGKLDLRFSGAKGPSKAPEPGRPVGGRSGGTGLSDQADIKSWMAARMQQVRPR